MQSTVIDIYVYFLKIGHRRITFLEFMISVRDVTNNFRETCSQLSASKIMHGIQACSYSCNKVKTSVI